MREDIALDSHNLFVVWDRHLFFRRFLGGGVVLHERIPRIYLMSVYDDYELLWSSVQVAMEHHRQMLLDVLYKLQEVPMNLLIVHTCFPNKSIHNLP